MARRNRVLSVELFEDWSEEVAEAGTGPCASVEGTSFRHFTRRKVEVETADGGSRQERIGVAISCSRGE